MKLKPLITSALNFEPQEEMLDIYAGKASLDVGIPSELFFQENRIALTPEAVGALVCDGHRVVVEHNAGLGSHFSDREYSDNGAIIAYDRAEVFKSPIIVKSAPVMKEELPMLQPEQLIISPIIHSHLQPEILSFLMERKVSAISFEKLKDDSGSHPIVRSMSEIAGSAVMLIAGQYLSSFNDGKGVLLGGICGVPPTKVIVIGAGIVGEFAARNALALGASVKVFDNDIYRLKKLQNNLGFRIWTSVLEPRILGKQLKSCEVAVGALSSRCGGRVPVVVTENMVSRMRPGSIIVDVSIDKGGCFETSELTNHEHPIVIKHDVIHYGVPNIPSGFARTASQAISNVLMPLMLKISSHGGIEEMVWQNGNMRDSFYLYKGALTDYYLSQRTNLKYTDLNLLLASSR